MDTMNTLQSVWEKICFLKYKASCLKPNGTQILTV